VNLDVADSDGDHANASPDPLVVSDALVLSGPTVSKPFVDVGQSVSIGAHVVGGSGGLVYSWSGLPPSCSTGSSAAITCTATQPGNYSISVSVRDSNGNSKEAGPINVSILPSPRVALSISPSSLSIGARVYINATVAGGAPYYVLSYAGLPGGCATANTTSLSCQPSAPGGFTVQVTAVDRAGGEANASASFNVSATSQTTTQPAYLLVALGVGGLIAVALVALLVIRRRRRPPSATTMPSAPEDPPQS
jgi:hypothetical protein